MLLNLQLQLPGLFYSLDTGLSWQVMGNLPTTYTGVYAHTAAKYSCSVHT